MKLSYEVEAMKEKISLVIHAIAGCVMGYVSTALNNPLYAAGLAIAVLLVAGYATEFMVKKKGIKWWLSNGGLLYLLFWLVMWVFFFNYTII